MTSAETEDSIRLSPCLSLRCLRGQREFFCPPTGFSETGLGFPPPVDGTDGAHRACIYSTRMQNKRDALLYLLSVGLLLLWDRKQLQLLDYTCKTAYRKTSQPVVQDRTFKAFGQLFTYYGIQKVWG